MGQVIATIANFHLQFLGRYDNYKNNNLKKKVNRTIDDVVTIAMKNKQSSKKTGAPTAHSLSLSLSPFPCTHTQTEACSSLGTSEYNQRKSISMTSGTSPSALCVAVFKIPFATGNNKLRASYTLTMESFEENYDLATRQACSVLSGNDCK